jgi:hypothetical protein
MTLDAETGMPLLPAQRALTIARLVEDASGEILRETVVLPNVVFQFAFEAGVRVGGHLMAERAYARKFAFEELPPFAEHVTGCEECEAHQGHSLLLIDPEEEFSATN